MRRYSHSKTKMNDRFYGVAIRVGTTLFLELRIRRVGNGDIFVMWHRDDKRAGKKKWNPHASFHEDKSYHHKSFNHPFFPISGKFVPVNCPISASDFRGTPLPFDEQDFVTIFEIPVEEISNEKYRNYIRVELIGLGADPLNIDGEMVHNRATFDDTTPYIVVTHYELEPISLIK